MPLLIARDPDLIAQGMALLTTLNMPAVIAMLAEGIVVEQGQFKVVPGSLLRAQSSSARCSRPS